MTTTTTTSQMRTRAMVVGACMTVDGRPVFERAAPIAPDDYDAEWRARTPGTPVRGAYYWCACYVSTYVEADDGREIEISALVDVRPGGRAKIDDYRCRVVDGAEVALTDDLLEEQRDRLVAAAVKFAEERFAP